MKNHQGPFKSGFVSILGAPNVGKSTLLNRMLGQKIAITSEKRQTTRHRIMGIVHLPEAQIIFLDTPGIHRGSKALNQRLVEVAVSTLSDVDLVVFMIDVTQQRGESEEMVVEAIKENHLPVILVINKIDLFPKEDLLRLMDQWKGTYPFKAIVPISALQGSGVKALIQETIKVLPEGPPYYPENSVTDIPERFIAAEMIREKVFRLTGEEIPYAVAVTIDSFKERSGKDLIDIHATIHVEKASQKPIVIGKAGAMLKKIGEYARKDIEQMLGCRVFLKLWVRVQKNWTKDENVIRRLGY